MNHTRTLLLVLLLPSLSSAATNPIAFTHVTVIDVTGGPAHANQTVVVTGERITAVGPADTVVIPADARVIDVTGKFLIPGLWDMHVHWYQADYLPLFTVNGVTGIRVMWGMPVNLQWRKEIAAGKLHGPRLALAGSIVDGPNPIWPGSTIAGTEAAGRQAVRQTKERGYDFVKVYNLLPRDAYFAIADEAKKQGLPFAGHVPYCATAAEASDAGQKSMEHLYGILLACSSEEAKLTQELTAVRKDPKNPDRSLLRRINQQMVDTYDANKAGVLFAKFKANGTWQCPTLTVLRSIAYLDDPKHTNDVRLKYMPQSVRSSWDPKSDFRLKTMTKEDFAQQRRMFDRNLELVAAMHRAGVAILAGTDVLNPYCFPGFSIHDELGWLVKSGLSPTEALQTATLNPARYLGQAKEVGTIEQGKMADLVLLEANPLVDISNTQRIAAVVMGGKYFPRKRLEKLRDHVAEIARKDAHSKE
jgi:imidazolonepropionase-like amidohydrolase